MANGKIEVAGLPLVMGGPYDTIVGVDEATGAARRFPMPSTEGIKGYATLSDLQGVSGTPNQVARVTNDPDPSRNGLYRWSGAVWIKSDDDLSALERQVAALGGITTTGAGAGSASALPPTPAGYRRVIIDGVPYAMPYYNFIEPLDLFVIVGQSNAEGRGNAALSPAAPNGRYWNGSSLAVLADPVGGAATGSMWPSFANEWYSRTGRMSAFVEAATGDTGLLAAAGGPETWAPSGTLRAQAVAAANAAILGISESGAHTLGAVHFIWCQGERDAETYNGTTVTGPLYEQALEDLAAYFKAQVPQMVTMGVVQSGQYYGNPSHNNGFFHIRAAQDDACDDSPNLTMLYRGAYSFGPRGLQPGPDHHWYQSGYNMAGRCAARQLAAPEPAKTSPLVLASTPYPDANFDLAASRTQAHTTAIGTRCVAVAVSFIRYGATTTYTVGATFGGVQMAETRTQAANNSSPASRVTSAIFYIDEAMFGGSLSGVTASIVAAPSFQAQMIDICVFDMRDAVHEESRPFFKGNTTDPDIAALVTANDVSAVISCTAAFADAAAPLTATVSGATEQMDHGFSNGTDRAGMCAVALSAESGPVYERSHAVTFSGACRAIASVIAVFRHRYPGE